MHQTEAASKPVPYHHTVMEISIPSDGTKQSMSADLNQIITKWMFDKEKSIGLQMTLFYNMITSAPSIIVRLNQLKYVNPGGELATALFRLTEKYDYTLFFNLEMVEAFDELLHSQVRQIRKENCAPFLDTGQQQNIVARLKTEKRIRFSLTFDKPPLRKFTYFDKIDKLYNQLWKLEYLEQHEIALSYFGQDFRNSHILEKQFAEEVQLEQQLRELHYYNYIAYTRITLQGLENVVTRIVPVINHLGQMVMDETVVHYGLPFEQYFPDKYEIIHKTILDPNMRDRFLKECSAALLKVYKTFRENGNIRSCLLY